VIPCPDWEWAELDGERLVWAAQGKLFAAGINESGLEESAVLFDFSDMTLPASEPQS